MKIAIFSDNFFPEITGIGDSIITTASELASHGHEIHFVVPRYAKRNFKYVGVPFKEIFIADKVFIHRLPSLPFPGPTKQSRLVIPLGLGWLKLRKIKPDVIHSNSFFGLGLEALFAAKLLKVPLVGTNHTPIGEYIRYSPIRNKFIAAWLLKVAARYFNSCDYVTAPAKSVLDELVNYNFHRLSKIIPNPVNLELFKPATVEEKNSLKKIWGLTENTVFYAGRLAPEKHVDMIIRAVKLAQTQIPNINLALAGRGNAEQDLRQLTETLGVSDKVKFLGMLDKEKLAQVYQASEIFVMTSTVEVHSLALMQAMATGLPVIGVKARGLEEQINDTNGMMVLPGDHEALADKIVGLMQQNERRDRLGQGGIDTVAQFAPDRIAKMWEELYNYVLDRALKTA